MILLRFSPGTGLAGAAVRWATWSNFGHVGFKMPDGSVLDATPGLGCARHFVTDDPGTAYFRIPAPAPVLEQAVRWAQAQADAHVPYDYLGVLGIGLRRDWRHPGQWWCSEYCERAMEIADWPLIAAGYLSRISPEDLRKSVRLEWLYTV